MSVSWDAFLSFGILYFPWHGAGAGRWKECEMPLEQNGAAPRQGARLLLEQAPAPRKSFLPCSPRDEERLRHSKKAPCTETESPCWMVQGEKHSYNPELSLTDTDTWLSQRDWHPVVCISLTIQPGCFSMCSTSLSTLPPLL